MKKNKMERDVKNFELKLFTFLVTGAITTLCVKLYQMDVANSEGEINIISDPTIETTVEPIQATPSIEYTYTEIDPVSDEYYRSIIVGGKTLNFVATPTPTNAPNYEIIDSYSDEMIIGEDGVYPEGYLEYAEMKEHSLNFKTVDQAVNFYSKVFELDESVCLEIINSLDTSTYELDKPCVINSTEYDTFEAGIFYTIFDLYKNPSNYGYNKDDITSNEGYQLGYHIDEELIYKLCKVLDVNPNVALAIAYGECGRKLNSYICENYHNYGGIVSNGGFAHYLNPAEGIAEFIVKLHKQYYVTADSGYSRIKQMAYGYCENPEQWIYLVGSIYFELEEYGYDYSYVKYGNNARMLILFDNEPQIFYTSDYNRSKNN